MNYLLDDYKQYASNLRPSEESWARLTRDATVDDVLACLTLYFPQEETSYYLKMIVVLFQEQCRNEAVREFMAKDLISWQERYISSIFRRLIETGALSRDIDVAFWAKMHANLNYASMARYVLGIGEMHPKFEGKSIEEMIRTMYDVIFRLYGACGQVQ